MNPCPRMLAWADSEQEASTISRHERRRSRGLGEEAVLTPPWEPRWRDLSTDQTEGWMCDMRRYVMRDARCGIGDSDWMQYQET